MIGLLLMALMMYLDAVLGLDTDVAPIAYMIGVLFDTTFRWSHQQTRSQHHADLCDGDDFRRLFADR